MRLFLLYLFISSSLDAMGQAYAVDKNYVSISIPSHQAESNLHQYMQKKVLVGQVWQLDDILSSDKTGNKLPPSQKHDIQLLADTITHFNSSTPYNYILHGAFQGTATIIALLNEMRSHGIKPEQIKALVLESPYTDMQNVIRHKQGKPLFTPERASISEKALNTIWHMIPDILKTKLAEKYLELTTTYSTQDAQPIHNLTDVPRSIPILLIHSSEDDENPSEEAWRLYALLAKNGHQYVHFYELASGEHGKYIHGKSSGDYTLISHAFYKKYGLPHDQQHADRGRDLLEESFSTSL